MIKTILKILIKYLLLISLGILIALASLEMGLRIIGVQPATYLRKFSQYHEKIGWVKKPDVEGYFQRGDVKIHEKLNSKGLRSPEYGYEKPANTYRILFLGDSFTEGYDVEFESLFSTILEKKLKAAYPNFLRFETINAGTGGYSNDQEFLYYQLEGCKYSPDLVIMMMYPANDVYYNAQNKYGNYFKPKYSIHHDSLLLTNIPLPVPPASESFKDLFRGLALYQFALNNVISKMPKLTEYLGSLGLLSMETKELATQKGRAPASFGIYEKNNSDKLDSAWLLTKKILSETKKKAEMNGSRFILFSIPDKFQIYESGWAATQEAYRVNDSIWDRLKPEKILDQFCKNENILFINLLDSLQKQEQPLPNLYNGVHWNEMGNEKAAEVLYRSIIPFLAERSH